MYDYKNLKSDIKILHCYDTIGIKVIGESVLRRDIYMIRLGKGKNEIFYNGAHHGQEWVTSWLLMRFVFDVVTGKKNICDDYSIFIVPMVNPDGVEIGKTVRGWQANTNGVDLNHNYDAKWWQGKEYIAKHYGVKAPGPTRYSGASPESEPEAKAVADFTRSRNFRYVIALHSQGEEIFWTYDDHAPSGSKRLAKHFSKVSGYSLINPSGAEDFSGYKDWFIKEYDRPGFTVEVGKGENPLPECMFKGIYEDVAGILLPK